ncbi:MAG: hypothetical protein D8M57_14820 [Candidatus Scalindua sp. AMX11]|nr:MAG: hypothetical protein DWQ00_04580 [Candidatus Scalindua sp.]NOG83596.1 hypothetical protein [Planctomycetota bacterium]RZV69651.1 MAG: hypothetical protein EX341_15965 [Candidatus Scalindua sp. SCAELEC01]TDE64084.1 MAG: hypothetical protein D8M57_14820 [Candidatus Scalindua sp. AMX11]GJQ60170.1 MAG: type I-B CRISPR-associated protein Cas7/Csh2 [Candidatus Scalindua sp.]
MNGTKETKQDESEFRSRCYGIIVIRSENSNFNADFTGNPRRLPDENGTIYATDKALKYAIRKYWVDNGENVFVWKTFREDKGKYLPYTLEERYNNMKQKLEKETPLEVFTECIDTKLFGITFAMQSAIEGESKNISLTGPVQISYGVNKYEENIIFSNDILSPYAKDSGDKSPTIGNENKAKEIYYVYDFVINPQNILNHYEDNSEVQEKMMLKTGDIDRLKDALKNAVTNLNTASKVGSENILTLFITMNEGSKVQIPTLKSLVKITKNNGIPTIDLTSVVNTLDNYGEKRMELYYDNTLINVDSCDKIDNKHQSNNKD